MSYMNRLHNARNSYQGDAKRVLCVCSAGLLRSPTIAKVLGESLGYNTRACGASQDYALIPIDPVLIAWADEIVFAHPSVFGYMKQEHPNLESNREVIVLNLPDEYPYCDPILIQMIKDQYAEKMAEKRKND